MDRKNNFLSKLKSLINTLDDDYLIGISNKGTFNRAKKDLEKAQSIECKINEENIEITIDDITCLVNEEVQKYKCSCPSRSICKHVIMCYLYIRQNSDDIFGKDENVHKNDADDKNEEEKEFVNLKEFSIDSIKKEIGEKNLLEIIRRIQFGLTYKIMEEAIITVDFYEEQVKVKLLNEIENCVCTCKSKNLCIHKAEALILYKLEKKYLTIEELIEYGQGKNYLDIDVIKKAASEIRALIEDILISGICRVPETILDSINNMAVKCHNYDLPNFEKKLRRIKEEISLYFKKHASFENKNLLNMLTKLYTDTITLENTTDLNKITELVGEFKTSYYNIPTIELHGIGEEKWTSKSGYKGTTYYFFENNKNAIFTFTKSIATFYDNNIKVPMRSTNNESPWNLNCSLNELSKIHFKLICGKINSQRRISSSSESKGVVIDKSDFNNINIDNYKFNSWEDIIEKVFHKKKSLYKNNNMIFIEGTKFGECDFDNITQTFKLEICDMDDKILEIEIKFTLESKSVIKNLERIYKQKAVPIFFGRTYIKEGKIKFYPISYYKNNEVENL